MATTIPTHDQGDVDSVPSSPRRTVRIATFLAATALALGVAGISASTAAAAVVAKDSHTSFAVNMRTAPSVSAPIIGTIPAGAPMVIYCQLPTSDPGPTTVRGFGTSWLWDFVLARVGEASVRGVISDLAANNTPYQVRDPSLPDCRNLGGLDLAGFCPSMAGLTHIELRWPAKGAYGWACVANNPAADVAFGPIPMNDVLFYRACVWTYGRDHDPGTFYAYYLDRSNPYTWRCDWRP